MVYGRLELGCVAGRVGGLRSPQLIFFALFGHHIDCMRARRVGYKEIYLELKIGKKIFMYSKIIFCPIYILSLIHI